METLRRIAPRLPLAVWGEFPSAHPDLAGRLPCDYALAGDPEPILRALLDNLDLPSRLKQVRGLIMISHPRSTSAWLSNLHGLSTPDWRHVAWASYQPRWPAGPTRASIRISRGQIAVADNHPFGGRPQPLRKWPLKKIAAVVQLCSSRHVLEAFLDDPPEVWTDDTLMSWCETLISIRNAQPWALRLPFRRTHPAAVRALFSSRCRRVEFILPAVASENLALFNCEPPAAMRAVISEMKQAGIITDLTFWVGGPWRRGSEGKNILRIINDLMPHNAVILPYPMLPPSPLPDTVQSQGTPTITEYLDWALDPWTKQRPLLVWGGSAAVEDIRRTMEYVRHRLKRKPRFLLAGFVGLLKPVLLTSPAPLIQRQRH